MIERRTNDEVLELMSRSKELLQTIEERELNYIDRVMKEAGYVLLRLIIERKAEGKRLVGRINSLLKDLRHLLGKTST